MRRIWHILVLVLALIIGLQVDLYGQKKDSPTNDRNAIDYRYQKYNNKIPVFPDSVVFRNKFYNIFSGGIINDWEKTNALGTSMTGLSTRFTIGYTLTPVHGIETDFLYNNIKESDQFGVNVNYVMNINNFANRRYAYNKLEALLIAGVSYKYAKDHSFGVNTGLRLQWNPGINAGIFIEPKMNLMSSSDPLRTISTQPSVSMGLTLRYHPPKYYLWDYLTPFAIKTNLLYDAATAINIGIEVPIRDHWSVAFDWVGPWWSLYNKQKYFQIMNGNMEGRYWFGNREDKYQLTGWFAGASVGGGIYDIMFRYDKGIQGEFQSYSLVGGYAHAINHSGTLRMEYSLGLGMLQSEYVKYWWDDFDYALISPSPQTWKTTWLGPTKAQVSLVYMLKIRSKVSGRQ